MFKIFLSFHLRNVMDLLPQRRANIAFFFLGFYSFTLSLIIKYRTSFVNWNDLYVKYLKKTKRFCFIRNIISLFTMQIFHFLFNFLSFHCRILSTMTLCYHFRRTQRNERCSMLRILVIYKMLLKINMCDNLVIFFLPVVVLSGVAAISRLSGGPVRKYAGNSFASDCSV